MVEKWDLSPLLKLIRTLKRYQQANWPKVTMLCPKKLQDQGTAAEKLVKVIFRRPTHKMAQHLKPLYIKGYEKEFILAEY